MPTQKIGTYIVNVFDSLYCKSIVQSITFQFEIFDKDDQSKSKSSTVQMCLEFFVLTKTTFQLFLQSLSDLRVLCV